MHVAKMAWYGIMNGMRILVNGVYGHLKKKDHTTVAKINLKRKKSLKKSLALNAMLSDLEDTFEQIGYKNTSKRNT